MSGEVVTTSTLRDFFAPAHFEHLRDDQRLSRPSFERMDAGFTVAADAIEHGGAVGAPVEYETRIFDSAFETRTGLFHVPLVEVLIAALDRGAAARSPLRSSGPVKFGSVVQVPPLVRLEEEQFLIASTVDLTTRVDISTPTGKGRAFHVLEEYLAAHPEDGGRLAVMSTDEVM